MNKFQTFKKLFEVKNLRILWTSESMNLIGDAFFTFAVAWIIYAETESMLYSSLIVVAMHLTNLIISPISGVITDKYNRKKIMILMTLLSSLIMFITAVAIYIIGEVTIEIAIIAVILTNITTSFYTNARSSITPDLVGKELFTASLGMFGIINQLSDIIGRLLAGALIVYIGSVSAVLLNSVFLLVASLILTLITMHGTRESSDAKIEYPNYFEMLKEGWVTIKNHPYLLSIVYITIFLNMASFFFPFYPALVYDQLEGNALTLSILSIAGILGGILGGLVSGNIERSIGVGKAMILSILTGGIFIIILGLSSVLIISVLAEFFLVFALVINGVMFNAVQSITIDAEVRGRVMGLVGVITMVSIPFMNLIAGYIGDIVGVSVIFVASGIWTLLVVPLMAFNKKIRNAEL